MRPESASDTSRTRDVAVTAEAPPAAPAVRPKLELKPRTIPVDQTPVYIGDPNIFGIGKAREATAIEEVTEHA